MAGKGDKLGNPMKIKNKRVFITGATSGIGKACARAFAEKGCHLLICARRVEQLEALAEELRRQYFVEVHAIRLDVSQPDDVQKVFSELPAQWQHIDILVNNAGVAKGLDSIQDARVEDIDTMFDTNVKGLLCVTQQVLRGMVARQQGHIINIGSISAFEVYPGGSIYCATKYAVRAISDGLKKEVHGSPIRVTEVHPGMVETEFSAVRFSGDTERADAVYADANPLHPEDIAEAVVFSATRPAHVDVREIKISPTSQTAAHMLHREKRGES